MQNNEFEFPNAILSSLNECTLGFCLAYVDQDGAPKIITKFDNQCFFLGVLSQLESWIRANKEIAKDMNISEMMGSCDCDENEED